MSFATSISIFFLLLISSLLVEAQSPVFSQYYSASLYLNPAHAGVHRELMVSSNYRTQWKSVDLPFKTFQVSCIYPIIRPGARGKHLGGLGISFLNDAAGPNNEFVTQAVHATGAYNFHLDKRGNNMIVVACQGGFFQSTINVSDSRWSQQFLDGTTAVLEDFTTRTFYPVLNVGMSWRYDRSSFTKKAIATFHGLSASNINRPNESVFDAAASVPIQIQLNGGFVFPINQKIEFCPTYLLRSQNKLLQTNTGAFFSYRLLQGRGNQGDTKITAGGWYRLKDSIILSAGLQTGSFACGFSYDQNVSSFNRYLGNGGAFEISAAYIKARRTNSKRISTPLI